MAGSRAGAGNRRANQPLDRQDASPLYQQLKDGLRSAIVSGRYRPGQPIPPEPHLCADFGVSRITVRRAIAELQDDGLLEKRHGKGTFVSQRRVETSLVDLAGFSESYSLRGMKRRSVILAIAEVAADARIASCLNIGVGDRLTRVTRLISADDRPMTIDESDLPDALFPGIASLLADDTSIYGLLREHFHRDVRHARRSINVRLATARERQLIGCHLGEPMFEIEKIASDSDGVPLQRSLLVTPAKATTLTISV
jgi:GntR family transcriptional regulator, frlABCD operon transcriptional regulator